MTKAEIKEANRYYWIVKGHLIPKSWKEQDIQSIYDGYFKRIWCNNENYVYEEGFEKAYTEQNNFN